VIGNWNITSLRGKRHKLVEEDKRYGVDVVGISSTKRRACNIMGLGFIWKILCYEIEPKMSA